MIKTILVVDDEPGHVALLETTLRQRGYLVLSAHNGQEALRKVRDSKPHLVILDIMMPELDGTDVAALLKGNPATADIPIIFITAVIAPEDNPAVEGGANTIFSKPVDLNKLLEKIKEVIG